MREWKGYKSPDSGMNFAQWLARQEEIEKERGNDYAGEIAGDQSHIFGDDPEFLYAIPRQKHPGYQKTQNFPKSSPGPMASNVPDMPTKVRGGGDTDEAPESWPRVVHDIVDLKSRVQRIEKRLATAT